MGRPSTGTAESGRTPNPGSEYEPEKAPAIRHSAESSRRITMTKFISMFFITASLALAASPIFAADHKIYPGSMCLEQNEVSQRVQRESGTISGGQWGTSVSCPIMRDTMASGFDDIYVHVMDWGQANFSCQLKAFNRYTGNGTVVSVFGSSTIGRQTLRFPRFTPGNYYAYTIDCNIPDNYSRILAIKVNEQ
jgi:hypothetical protein